MNDSHVSPVSVNKVLSAEAYILFYSKVSTSPPKQLEAATSEKDAIKEKMNEEKKVQAKQKSEEPVKVKGMDDKKEVSTASTILPLKLEKHQETVRPRSLSEDSSRMHHVPAVYTSLLINEDGVHTGNVEQSGATIDGYGRLRKPKPWVFMLPMRYCWLNCFFLRWLISSVGGKVMKEIWNVGDVLITNEGKFGKMF
jgi:hypothetical protein